MANIIQIKSGTKASLPTLSAREFGFTTDTHQVYIGDGAANHELARVSHSGSKTSASWSKTIGATGDYATWAAMIADMPDLIAHAVTVTIQAGTTLTETCELKNKHGITKDGAITIQAEKYFPTSGTIPTADSATATTLRDAALATAALGNDYFNGCWVFVVDGTGTDNGFVLITDYVDATGDVVVASWPGTQPDNTSRYLIVGALIDCEGTRAYGLFAQSNTSELTLYGLGATRATSHNILYKASSFLEVFYCGSYDCVDSGFLAQASLWAYIFYSGIVKSNTGAFVGYSGVCFDGVSYGAVRQCGLSDNNKQGILSLRSSFVFCKDNFGDGNGLWGTYCLHSGQAYIDPPECSGSSGNHSDPGTAGNANADQAAVY